MKPIKIESLLFFSICFVLMGFPSASMAAYQDGVRAFNERRYAEAVTQFEEAAKLDDTNAIKFLATIYDQGLGMSRNPKLAYETYRRLAMKGDSNAMLHLGMLTVEGIAVPTNIDEAREWYKKALANGAGAATYCLLAKTYEPYLEESESSGKMLLYLKKAADDVSFPPVTDCANEARAKLSELYEAGNVVDKDLCSSVRYRGEWLAYGGALRKSGYGNQNWIANERKNRRLTLLQASILASMVSQYNMAKRMMPQAPSVNEDAFVKAVLSDYTGADRDVLLAVLKKNGLGTKRDVDEAARYADKAIATITGRADFSDEDMQEWARSFYSFDFRCLKLSQ